MEYVIILKSRLTKVILRNNNHVTKINNNYKYDINPWKMNNQSKRNIVRALNTTIINLPDSQEQISL